MKLAGAAGVRFCNRPDPALSGVLLFGPDASLLGVNRRDLTAALSGGDDAQITRLEPDTVRRDPAALDSALRARGFFGGRPVVVIDRAKDNLTEALATVLPGLTPQDGVVVLTAEGLTKRSSLRRLFEDSGSLIAIGLYPDPPDAGQIAGLLAAAGCRAALEPEAERLLLRIAADLDAGGLRQMLETLALYAGDAPRISQADVAAVAPASIGAETDRLMEALALGRAGEIGPLLARLAASGTPPDRAVGAAGRHFSSLLALAAGGGQGSGWNPRAAALESHLRGWGRPQLEEACRQIFRTEGQLRAGGPRPVAAMAERCLLRIAMMVRDRGA